MGGKDGAASFTIWGALIVLANTMLASKGVSIPMEYGVETVNFIGVVLTFIGRTKKVMAPVVSVFGIPLPWADKP